MGSPQSEDDQGDGEPAQGLNGLIGLGRARVVHDVEQTAQTRDAAADDGGTVLVGVHVDAHGIGGGGVLTHGAEVESHLGLGQHHRSHHGDGDGQVDHDAQVLPGGTGEQDREGETEGGECLQVGVAFLTQARHDEAHDARAEDGQGQTRDVLVGLEADGQDAVEQTHETCGEESGQDAQDHDEESGDVPCQDQSLDHGTAACRAYAHDTGDTQVEVAYLLGDDFTRGAVEEGHAQGDGVDQKINDVIHAWTSLLVALFSVATCLGFMQSNKMPPTKLTNKRTIILQVVVISASSFTLSIFDKVIAPKITG